MSDIAATIMSAHIQRAKLNTAPARWISGTSGLSRRQINLTPFLDDCRKGNRIRGGASCSG